MCKKYYNSPLTTFTYAYTLYFSFAEQHLSKKQEKEVRQLPVCHCHFLTLFYILLVSSANRTLFEQYYSPLLNGNDTHSVLFGYEMEFIVWDISVQTLTTVTT